MMFKRSRRKIVAAIMSILVLIWAGSLGLIYISSYVEMANRNKQMLKDHAQMYDLEKSSNDTDMPQAPDKPEDTNEPVKPGDTAGIPGDPNNSGNGTVPDDQKGSGDPGNRPEGADTPAFKLSTFYTVAISYDGEILETDNENSEVHSDEELQEYATEIADDRSSFGTKDNLVFYKTDKGDYYLITLMDNTLVHESMNTLFRYTFIFGGAAIVVLFFISVFLARKIVSPLEESYKKQKQFISDAGHELKTPVSVVSANAELLSREIGSNQWLSNIQYENERMGNLVGQLLELARTENVSPQCEELDLSHLVNGEALPFESVAFEKGFVLDCRVDDNINIYGNSTQLKQIVSILIDNAIRHNDIDKGRDITLKLTKEHGNAILSVANSGDEIPKEKRDQLFERFYRADDARTAGSNNYGLGLAIAKAIATSHGGKIKVSCHGELVEFIVTLPLHGNGKKKKNI